MRRVRFGCVGFEGWQPSNDTALHGLFCKPGHCVRVGLSIMLYIPKYYTTTQYCAVCAGTHCLCAARSVCANNWT